MSDEMGSSQEAAAQQHDITGALVVMTHPSAQVRLVPEGIRSLQGADVRGFSEVIGRQNVRVRQLFGASEDRLSAIAGTQGPAVGIDIPDLSVFYRVEAPAGQLSDLAAELLDQEIVTAAYVEPRGETPLAKHLLGRIKTAVPPVVSPDFTGQQGYLDAAPGGVDARYAWTLDGGTGATVRIIDVELGGWQFTHEDLRANQGGAVGDSGAGISPTEAEDRSHATAVIGEIGGDRNSIGITGIAPDAQVRGCYSRVHGVAAAIRTATDQLGKGDIIIIEAHAPGPTVGFTVNPTDTTGYIPMEWWEHVFQAILYAVAHGVIVVEAAGNGSMNLDAPIFDTPGPGFPPEWRNPFDRTARDSHAIVVGAGAPPSGSYGEDRSRLDFSNYGNMVDAQGWGAGVTTTGYGDLQGGWHEDEWYTSTFAGTSSATPIVVGALACVQGTRSAHIFEERLTPMSARQRIRETGTPQTDAPGQPASQRIGNRPSIGQMIPGPVIYALVPVRVPVAGPPTGGQLLWYRHLGRRDGTDAWADGPRMLTKGWDRLTPFSGRAGVVYAINGDGDLLWRRHIGAGDGSNSWSPVVKIGSGWDFTHVFCAGAGAIYAVRGFGIDPVTGRQLGGDLLMYEHLGWSDGTPRWNGEPQLVGTKWFFDHIFAGDDGVIYAVTRDGDLWRYYHDGRGVRANIWGARQQIGRGWVFDSVFYGGGGVIYAIDAAGDLWWDRDDASKGPRSGPPHLRVGQGWHFETVFGG